MRYKREEAFRFQFRTPLEGKVKIVHINGKKQETPSFPAAIMDISPNGTKFKSPMDLSIGENQYLIEISFNLNANTIRMLGEPVWKKAAGSEAIYGFSGLEDEQTRREIIQTLKEYSKKLYHDLKTKQ
ncbi:PilZ domain-containing protein [Bacillus sp. ISL-47]|uniref:PilZ domain-containing protein n=1 Tax=Bacillus sp. ISL-47 TaxID=2819130 RepID=UPI001BE6D6DA|nr:PilZ domain-containing protein [Bacillus sp. ISL-47]MBT2687802.1 PilZ domain-containing protein [Bacillus sp. ISL-47]MBT2708121.1 PilZ domain-containing protein [Pseudomonas sp. ISL-84]